MIRASNIESIERNLTLPSTSSPANGVEQMEIGQMQIGQMQPYNDASFRRPLPTARAYPSMPYSTINGRFPTANAFG